MSSLGLGGGLSHNLVLNVPFRIIHKYAQLGSQLRSLWAILSGHFPKLLIHLQSSGFLGLPFFSLPAESWGFISPILPYTSHNHSNRRAEGNEKQWDLPHSLETTAPPIWEEGSYPFEIQAPACPTDATAQDCLRPGVQENEERGGKKEKREGCGVATFWVLEDLFPLPWVRTNGILLVLFLSMLIMLTSKFQDTLSSVWGILEEKKW